MALRRKQTQLQEMCSQECSSLFFIGCFEHRDLVRRDLADFTPSESGPERHSMAVSCGTEGVLFLFPFPFILSLPYIVISRGSARHVRSRDRLAQARRTDQPASSARQA
jgi:hypothetical protein